jgi:hypothetical protein
MHTFCEAFRCTFKVANTATSQLYPDSFLVLECELIDTVYKGTSLCDVIMNSLLPLAPVHRYDHL